MNMNDIHIDSLDLDLFEPLPPKALDSSMVSTFMSCPRKFYLEYILGLRPHGEKIALTYGSLWHEILEDYYKNKDTDRVADIVLENHNTFDAADPKNRTAQRMGNDFVSYLAEWGSQDREDEILAIEQSFDLELPNGHTYCGRIDQVRKRGDKFGILDHKTTTFFTKNYFENFELGFQMKGYLWAMSQLIPEATPSFAIIDVKHILKNNTNFYRQNLTFRPSQIAEWVENMCRITDRIWHLVEYHLYDPEEWVLNGGQRCSDYGGCPFKLVHQLPPERGNRERILKHEFEVYRWDPIAHEDIERQKPEG